MLHEALLFKADEQQNVNARFNAFIQWAQPFGDAGINHLHASSYSLDTPYFSWGAPFLAQGDKSARSWLLKREYLQHGRQVFLRPKRDVQPTILNSQALISGRFLHFAKAYINVISYYRSLRSLPKPLILALIFLEKALRDLNNGNNDPSNFRLRTFESAIRDLIETPYAASVKYDISKDIDMMAGMLQSGYQSKSFRFDGKGFRLLEKPFAFSAGVPQAPRLRVIKQEERAEQSPQRLSSEVVAAVGLAYRKAVSIYGIESPIAFFAAIVGLPFTTTSMRMSELLVLSRDALYVAEEGAERYRLRISRPKINVHQDLPLTHRLGPLTAELVEGIKAYSAGANEALHFYIENFGGDFDAINELFIPPMLRDVFAKPYLTHEDINFIFGTSYDLIWDTVPRGIEVLRFVETPYDISPSVSTNCPLHSKLLRPDEIEHAFKAKGLLTYFPSTFDRRHYISKAVARRYIQYPRGIGKSLLDALYLHGRASGHYIRRSDLSDFLLKDFKARRPPHWPYVTKDKTTKVNEALLVRFEPATGGTLDAAHEKGMWWRPAALSAGSIMTWITHRNSCPPLLFAKLGIRLKNGDYPSLTLHQTRKYHHTEALLAGVNEMLLDELAGRKTGRQSDHYDLRTPHEIVVQSIDTFDPEEDFRVIGPVADQAKNIKVTDRKAFLYENAAPKHITEVGGCTTDWSLNPCDQFGSCTRCDKQVWRKGDKKRLPFIEDKRMHALRMIGVAEQKVELREPSHSLIRQLQQFKDDLARCDAILAVEDNDSIENGTLVTFETAEGACGVSELMVRLRHEIGENNAITE